MGHFCRYNCQQIEQNVTIVTNPPKGDGWRSDAVVARRQALNATIDQWAKRTINRWIYGSQTRWPAIQRIVEGYLVTKS